MNMPEQHLKLIDSIRELIPAVQRISPLTGHLLAIALLNLIEEYDTAKHRAVDYSH